ncbi:MAG: MFS transporter [Lautropia sp.]
MSAAARPPGAAAPEPPLSGAFLRVLVFGCVILLLSNGARSSWGLFLPELTQARGWSRETFSLAIALQNLIWGLGGSLLGAMADRWGAMRTLMLGATLYVAGFVGTLYATTGASLNLTAGALVGLGIAGTAFGAVFTAVGKLVPPSRRSWAFGIGTAAGSFGQFLFLPLTAWLIRDYGWATALALHAAAVAAILPLALAIRGDREAGQAQAGSATLGGALREAAGDRNFHLLFWGYFVCGLQVVFIGLHLPAYLTDKGMPLDLGAKAIALVGLFNVVGCLASGWLGVRVPKTWLLTGIYVGRSIAMAVFLLVPLSAWSVYVFAAVIGVLWLSTVPPTNALLGQIWGVRNFGLLVGIVFFGHQIGSFLGAWLGGRIFDLTGSYDLAWAGAIAFGAFAALMHLPIDQRPIGERRAAAAAA